MTENIQPEYDIAAILFPFPAGLYSTDTALEFVREHYADNWEMLVNVAAGVAQLTRDAQVTLILESWYSKQAILELVVAIQQLPPLIIRRLAIVAALGRSWRHTAISPLYAAFFPREQVNTEP